MVREGRELPTVLEYPSLSHICILSPSLIVYLIYINPSNLPIYLLVSFCLLFINPCPLSFTPRPLPLVGPRSNTFMRFRELCVKTFLVSTIEYPLPPLRLSQSNTPSFRHHNLIPPAFNRLIHALPCPFHNPTTM